MPDVSDNNDWKQKYRDSLLEMQADENRWRQTEQVLRRLVGRLCAAGMGVDTQLDQELSALAAANRRNADAEELARIADSLTTTVVAVDNLSPVPQSPRQPLPQKVHAAITALVEQLPLANSQGDSRDGLLTELKAADTDASLAGLVTRIADLVHEHSNLLARDRLQAASVLAEVTKRLEEVAHYLTESSDASQSRYADAQSYNESVMWQVRELTGEVNSATELNALQRLVSTRLERVTQEVCDFRAREENRLLESNGRAEQMRTRILALEREAQELNAKLLNEKQEARLDPMTGIANRKSFEERMSRELARVGRGEGRIAIMLWDIDNFKQINDTYGHRAGDRVLQNVASCFTAAARESDFVARIGGEEFVLLIEGVALAEAVQIANKVRTAVEALRFHFRGTPVKVTASCGVTEIQQKDSQEAAYDRADSALYRAKHGGKNLCVAA
jgi:diguanylate cyclase